MSVNYKIIKGKRMVKAVYTATYRTNPNSSGLQFKVAY